MPGAPETDRDRGQLFYDTAYFVLPRYVYEEPERTLGDFARQPDLAAKFFYLMACRIREREPNVEDARRVTARSGMLNDDRSYHIVEYPALPPVDITSLPREEAFAEMRRVVLAPYFSAIIYREGVEVEHYLVLGQSPDGATTLRRVTPQFNANLGRGCEPSFDSFLSLLRSTLRPGGRLPPAIAGVGRDEPPAKEKRWWQFWRR